MGVPAINLYVDAVNGSDANNGSTPYMALKTLAALVAAVGSKTGQVVGLAAGSVWKEQLTLHANNDSTTVIAYGFGPMPMIDGGDTIPPVNFALTTGQAFTYQTSVAFAGIVNGVEQRLIWENNANLVQVGSIAAVESTPGSFFYDNYNLAMATVYVHAKDGSNPATNGKVYDYTNRYYALSIWGSNCLVDGIRTRRQRGNNGSVEMAGDNCTIQNGIAEDGHKHCAYIQEGSTVTNYVFRNAYNGLSGFPNYLVFNKNVATGLPNSVTGCQFITDPTVVPSSSGVAIQLVSSVIGHVNTSGAFGQFVATDNVHSQTSGYLLANGGNQTITGDAFTNCTIVGQTPDAVTVTISGVTITNTLLSVISLFSSNITGSGRLSVACTDCVINSGTALVKINGNNIDMALANCTITAGNTSTRFPQGLLVLSGTGGTLIMNGTTLKQTIAGQVFVNLAPDTVYVGDHNAFIRPSGNWTFERGNAVVATSLSAWQTYSGQDANSTAT